MDITLRWSEAWEPPRAVQVTSAHELRRLLADIHDRASASGLASAVDVECDERALSIVLGTQGLAFLQWMGGSNGSYLAVDVGETAGTGGLVTFTYQGHHSEIPLGDCVPLEPAVEEVILFAETGSLSTRWRWTGWLADGVRPGEGVDVVDDASQAT